MMKHTSDGVPAEGHDSHSPSLQTCPGSHLTKFTLLESLAESLRWTKLMRGRLSRPDSTHGRRPSSACDKRPYRNLYVHAEANKGLQGTHGFPQSKSDQKIQELHARKTQMENLKLVVATGQVCRFRQWSRGGP
jgi:hypothetical protein